MSYYGTVEKGTPGRKRSWLRSDFGVRYAHSVTFKVADVKASFVTKGVQRILPGGTCLERAEGAATYKVGDPEDAASQNPIVGFLLDDVEIPVHLGDNDTFTGTMILMGVIRPEKLPHWSGSGQAFSNIVKRCKAALGLFIVEGAATPSA